MELAVETKALTRVFKPRRKIFKKRQAENGGGEAPVTALEAVDLEIREGELFGLLGPNGAGKTTLIKILCTLLLPTTGVAKVAGFDVTKDPFPIRTRINMVSGGGTSGDGPLTTRENGGVLSPFYGGPSKGAKAPADELLQTLRPRGEREAQVRTLP